MKKTNKEPKKEDFAKVVAKGYWNQWICKTPVDGFPMIEYNTDTHKFVCVSSNSKTSDEQVCVLKLEEGMFGDLYSVSRPEFEQMLIDDYDNIWEDVMDQIESHIEEEEAVEE
jgi:hypothetical protein